MPKLSEDEKKLLALLREVGGDLRKNVSMFDESLKERWVLFVSACSMLCFAATSQGKRARMISAQSYFDGLSPLLRQNGISNERLDELKNAIQTVSSSESLTHDEPSIGSGVGGRK